MTDEDIVRQALLYHASALGIMPSAHIPSLAFERIENSIKGGRKQAIEQRDEANRQRDEAQGILRDALTRIGDPWGYEKLAGYYYCRCCFAFIEQYEYPSVGQHKDDCWWVRATALLDGPEALTAETERLGLYEHQKHMHLAQGVEHSHPNTGHHDHGGPTID